MPTTNDQGSKKPMNFSLRICLGLAVMTALAGCATPGPMPVVQRNPEALRPSNATATNANHSEEIGSSEGDSGAPLPPTITRGTGQVINRSVASQPPPL